VLAVEERRVAVVVEDDEDIRGLMVSLLGQSGFEVHEASNGTDGVHAVRENDPVLVTVDLGLPDIDGYEVTRQLRRFTDAYVVMLTARAEEIDTLLGLDAGADDYLTKPFRPRELRARIEAMMRRPRMGQSPGEALAQVPAAALSAAAPGSHITPSVSVDPVPTSTPTSGAPVADNAGAGASVTIGTAGVDSAEADARLSLNRLELYSAVHQVMADGREVSLTPTEFLLLETLMRSGRVVRSKAELSRIIRGDEPGSGTFVSLADERTVEVHVANLRRKLGDDPKTPRWIQTIRGVGYRLAGSTQVTR
jgi:two-component system, OmpR family, response regulator